MPDYIISTRAIKDGSFSSEPGPTRFLKVLGGRAPGPSHEITHSATDGWASRKHLQPETTPLSSSNYPWFEIAHAESGTREVNCSGYNPQIVAYHRSTSLDAPSAYNDETPWCSSFVNWCFERSGHVAFFVSKTATKIKVLGGNQSDEVNLSEYPTSRLLGYRFPV